MSERPQVVPDLAALYLQHRDAMYRVAASVLRGAGLVNFAADAVQDAIVSMMTSPPSGVRNWEAFMVAAAKRKAFDRCRSAAVGAATAGFDLFKGWTHC
jgi:DNA-directed RNA polymerase specialized sigma24 family protein